MDNFSYHLNYFIKPLNLTTQIKRKRTFILLIDENGLLIRMNVQNKISIQKGKNIHQSTLEKFIFSDSSLNKDTGSEQNLNELRNTVIRSNYSFNLDIKKEFNQIERPKTITELLSSFKELNSTESLKEVWNLMQNAKTFNANDPMIKKGILFESSKHAAVISSENGLDCFNLREIYQSRETKIFHFSEEELIHKIKDKRKGKNTLIFRNVKIDIELLKLLISALKNNSDSTEIQYYTIGIIMPNENDDGYWPIIVRNNNTQMLGLLAPSSY